MWGQESELSATATPPPSSPAYSSFRTSSCHRWLKPKASWSLWKPSCLGEATLLDRGPSAGSQGLPRSSPLATYLREGHICKVTPSEVLLD